LYKDVVLMYKKHICLLPKHWLMRFLKITIILLALTLHSAYSYGQDTNTTTIPNITEVPLKFIKNTNDKIEKYSDRLTLKTLRTLEKLAKFESKIYKLLLKADPNVANQLFGEGKETFASMLAKIKEGKSLAENASAKYSQYTDELTTHIKYIETQKDQLDKKFVKPLEKAVIQTKKLRETEGETETAERLIKERKKELLTQAYKVLGKNKYIGKIQQETFYYGETLKNYKEIFSEPGRAEQKALELLGKIPAVKDFVQQNSMLASLFGSPSPAASGNASLAGLQTRASIQDLISNRIAAGGPNAAAQISANMQAAQAELTKLKDKIIKAGSSSTIEGEDGLPSFQKKDLKSKTFKQRLELGSNFQFGRPNRIVASQADVAMSLGYKLSQSKICGLGISYKLNYGSIKNFYLQHGGVGLRSFMDWKIKKQFFITGSFELNYNESFKNFSEIQNANGTTGIGNAWAQSGLIGLTKKISFAPAKGGKTKLIKGTKVQLLFDMLYNTHVIPTQMLVFRIGQNF
jgi:hypothetical protein